MTRKNILTIASPWILLPLVLSLTPSLVQASSNFNEGYREVTYEELVSELNSKKASVAQKRKAPLNAISLGVGYVHSFTQLHLRQQVTERSQNGLQIAASMNLDSPHLYAESVLRNFSGSTRAQEDLQILQLDGRLGLKKDLTSQWKYHLFTGFSGRLIQASHAAQNYHVSEFTPSLTAGTGAVAEIHRNIRLGFEVGGRTSMLGKNIDRNSVDLTLRLDTSL